MLGCASSSPDLQYWNNDIFSCSEPAHGYFPMLGRAFKLRVILSSPDLQYWNNDIMTYFASDARRFVIIPHKLLSIKYIKLVIDRICKIPVSYTA